MRRAERTIAPPHGSPGGAGERVLVVAGELKVACGADVVFETVVITRGLALAAWDPLAAVGGVLVRVQPDGEPLPADDDGARAPLAALIDSVIRLGADRRRLRVTLAGDPNLLLLATPGAAQSPRRRASAPAPFRLVLDLGRGEAAVLPAG